MTRKELEMWGQDPKEKLGLKRRTDCEEATAEKQIATFGENSVTK